MPGAGHQEAQITVDRAETLYGEAEAALETATTRS